MSSTTTAEPKQFTLKDDGYIYFQQDASNPLPGDPIAQLLRGDHALSPVIRPLDSLGLDETAAAVVTEKLNTWFYLHCVKVMEPLVKMKPIEGENLPPPVAQICARLYDELGIVPRADVAEAIEGLDADMRKMLRARHVRLGPVLVFVPDLTKPAAVRLRAILWALYHNKPLPAPVPKDGAVSAVIETEGADPAFYQAIGYPLYGNRVIRIDMLDRVMGAVYDNVKDNQFQARHQMAEWLGCSIPDLYTVLESMGHKKVHDPAEVKAAAGEDLAAAVIPSESSPEETSAEESTPAPELPAASSEDIPAEVKAEEGADSSAPAPAPAPKPELATFRVWWPRRAGGEEKKERVRRAPKKTPPPIEKLTEEELKAIEERKAARREKFAKKEGDPKSDKEKRPPKAAPQKPFQRKHKEGAPRKDSDSTPSIYASSGPRKKPSKLDKQLRMISAAAPTPALEDSPFAALAALKFKSE